MFTDEAKWLYVLLVAWEVVMLVQDVVQKQLRRPAPSLRGKVFYAVIGGYLLLGGSAVWFNSNQVLGLDLLAYVVPFLVVIGTQPIIDLIRNRRVARAAAKISRIKPTIIGITGSQGKSTTKQLLAAILQAQAKTVATPKSFNNRLGLAETILNRLEPDTKYFVSEMGAYRPSEIRRLCRLTPPEVVMITGISPQHLGLFGSMDNLIAAKYELVEGADRQAPIFINVSSYKNSQPATQPIVNLAKKDKRQVFTYALVEKLDPNLDYQSRIVSQTVFSWSRPGKKAVNFTVNLTVNHLVENLTGAIAVADHLGVSLTQITSALKHLPELDRGLKVNKLRADLTLLDDSFNATPEGFKAALRELSKFKATTVVVTSGVKELGPMEQEVHEQLGKFLREVDAILLTSPEVAGYLRSGLGDRADRLQIVSPQAVEAVLKQLVTTPVAILIEGRIPVKIKETVARLIR
jgi:UDP-N-acetylmuramoyl-tripeptide--D-alanyl-D-alanine ligase